jgi:hypothetical protein
MGRRGGMNNAYNTPSGAEVDTTGRGQIDSAIMIGCCFCSLVAYEDDSEVLETSVQ